MKWLNGYRIRLPFGSELRSELMLAGFIIAGFLGDISMCQAAEPVWTQRADMPTPRWLHSSAVVNGKIYIIGGATSEPDERALLTVEEYDPVTNTWTRKADMPTVRSDMIGSSAVVDGKIYVIGGYDGGDSWGSPTVEEYDPATDTWMRKADMPTPRWSLATCAVDGKIYAIGGAPNYIKGLSTVEEYNPVTDTWTKKADMPTGVWGLCACVVDGKIYVLGGRPGYTAIPNVQEYDPATDTWMRKANMLTGTSQMASVVLDDKIIVIGGWIHSNNPPYKTVQMYDPETDTWTREPDAPFQRATFSAEVVNNKIYALGGTNRRHPCSATPTVYEFGAPPPDFNMDGIVDAADMCIMVDHWGTGETLCDIAPPPFGDGIVDIQDLIVLAEHLFEEVSDPALVAHWALDEIEGTIAYDSAGTCDGTLLRDPLWQPAGGMVDGALQLDGIDDYVSTPFILNPAKGSFSAFAWIKGGSPGQVVISQIGGEDWLLADAEGKLMTTLRRGSLTPALASGPVITDGDWHHIGVVWDGSHRHLYVDGTDVAEDATNIIYLRASNGGLYIGANKNLEAGTFFSGLIDDVRIYNRAVIP